MRRQRLRVGRSFRAKLLDLTGNWTVPQVLVDGRAVGGYTELVRLDREGRLERVLGVEAA